MFKVDIYNHTKTAIRKKLFIELANCAERVLIREKKIRHGQKFSFELDFIGEKKMTSQNAYHHGKAWPTDVISLSYFSHKMDDPFVGEIFICVPFARKQARKIGQSLQEELKFLFVHGLLHIFGYDHKHPRQEAQMLNLAYRILGRI